MLRLEDRLHGDKLLDALELIEEIKGVGGFVSENGMVLVYHSKIETARVVMGGQLNSCRCTERQRKNDPLRS